MRHEDDDLLLPSLRGQVESFFSEALGLRSRKEVPLDFWNPHLDLVEEEDRFVLEMDLPGVRREDVHVDIVGRHLAVTGRREIVRESAGPRFRHRERYYGSFRRTLELPAAVEPERVGFTLEQGILRIILPKRGRAGR